MKRWLVLLLVCLAVYSVPSLGEDVLSSRGDPVYTSEQSLRAIADATAFQGLWSEPSDNIWDEVLASGRKESLNMSPSEENISFNMNYLGYGNVTARSSHRDDAESYVDTNLNYIYKDYRPAGGSGSDLGGRLSRQSPMSIKGAMARSDQNMELSFDILESRSGSFDARYGESGYAASEDNLARLNGTREVYERPDPWALYGAKIDLKGYGIWRIGQSSQKSSDFGQIGKGRKNYALVIGINGYADRRGLHTCINDANTVAGILGTYGYEVILLTDNTLDKPTKHNILDGALSEICTKQDLGNVIIYFSGHAFRDPSGSFYLVPQDGRGVSSYIGAGDFDKYIKNLKNLALIIDACNSGGFDGEIFQGQVALLSSGADQPSNEEWPGHLSVFTSQLCEAIKDEHKKNNEVVLQKCFYIARNNTVHWSESRLLNQTPQIRDKTSGAFYLS